MATWLASQTPPRTSCQKSKSQPCAENSNGLEVSNAQCETQALGEILRRAPKGHVFFLRPAFWFVLKGIQNDNGHVVGSTQKLLQKAAPSGRMYQGDSFEGPPSVNREAPACLTKTTPTILWFRVGLGLI